MTWFADLSPYAYGPSARPMLNVGWLDPEHPFATGAVDADVRERLLALAARPESLTRGSHRCGLCDDAGAVGNGEVHVEHDGVVYAAPTLVVHHVDAHGYCPPAEFCAALRQG